MTENIFVDLNGNEQTQISFNDKFDTNDTILSSIKYPDHICLCKEHTYILTNIKSINFRLHDIATNVSVLADVYIGLCKVNTFSGIADALNNTNRYKAVHYNDANVFVPETVLTLDVSDYIGEYYIFITFNGWAGDILQISRIWTE